MSHKKCDNCGDELKGKNMSCGFCNEIFCSECASHHRDWCMANDEWDWD